MSPWTILWYGAFVVAGLVAAFMSWQAWPPSRASLTAAEAIAPVHATDELVTEWGGRRASGTYRRQNIAVSGGGRGYLVVSPPRTLWVPDIDRLERGTVVRFLIDPHARLIYEARLGERVLLPYETSAGPRRWAALGGLAVSAGLLAVGGFGLWRHREASRREAERGAA